MLVAVLVACSSSSDAGDDGSDEQSVDQILSDGADAMNAIESAAFTIEQTGASLFIDDTGQLGFESAEGRFARPASSEAVVTVDALGFTTEIGAIAIDGQLWFTNPLTGDWTEAPASFTFDPATLFDAERGIPALLTEARGSAELIDDAAAADVPDPDRHHHVRTTVGAERVAVLTGGLVTEESDVDLWIDVDSSRVVEARFDLVIDEAESMWRMTIGDYDAEVTIVAPELAANP